MVNTKMELMVDTTINIARLKQELSAVEGLMKNSIGGLKTIGTEGLSKKIAEIKQQIAAEMSGGAYKYTQMVNDNRANRDNQFSADKMVDNFHQMQKDNDPQLRRQKVINEKIIKEALKTAHRLREIKAEEDSKTYSQQEQAANAMLAKFKHMQRAKLDLVRRTENDIRKKATDTSRKIRESFETAFSIHILRTFITPFMNGLTRFVNQTITAFSEFDKAYADYIAKSQDFAQTASRRDLFELAAGEAFSVTNVAQAMERFAASGIDVSRNQKAVTDALRIATVAEVDFKEASNSVIKTMEAFNLTINDSTRIVDVMTNAANASTAELQDLIKWFEFTSGAANVSGLSIEQLSAILGTLASTGLPNVGTAFRQFLLQFQKADIREKFAEKFGFEDSDFRDMFKVIETMRDYVATAGDQALAVEELTQLLGGKANAQLTLNNILRATPELWTRLNEVVYRSGTALELYENATDNAAHSIDRIKNSMELLSAQVGYALNPGLKAAADIMQWFTERVTTLPEGFRMLIGASVLLSGTLASLGLAFVTVISFFAVLHGITMRLEGGISGQAVTVKSAIQIMLRFRDAIAMNAGAMSNGITVAQGYSKAILGTAKVAEYATLKEQAFHGMMAQTNGVLNKNIYRTQLLGQAMKTLANSVYLTMTIFAGFMLASSLAEKGTYGLANAVWFLVSALTALKVAGMVAGMSIFGPAGALAGYGTLVGAAAGTAVGAGVYGYGRHQMYKSRVENTSVNPGAYATANTVATYNIVNVDGMTVNDPAAANEFVRFFSEEL